jgi:hypothetical protein
MYFHLCPMEVGVKHTPSCRLLPFSHSFIMFHVPRYFRGHITSVAVPGLSHTAQSAPLNNHNAFRTTHNSTRTASRLHANQRPALVPPQLPLSDCPVSPLGLPSATTPLRSPHHSAQRSH